MDYPTDSGQRRESFVSALLAVLALAGVVFAFFLICGGFSVYVLAVVGGLAGLGYVNYLLWGRSLTRQVAGEREEEEFRDSLEREDEDWPLDERVQEPPF